MENQEHTPTPWEARFDGTNYFIFSRNRGSNHVADSFIAFIARYATNEDGQECDKANARRIVACVNFCEGEPIQNLEDNDLNGLLKRGEAKIKQMRTQITEQQVELDRLRQQNAKLVEVLENLIVEYQASYSFEDVESVEEIKAARAAIAEAEKE